MFFLDLSGLFAQNSHLQCDIYAFSDRELRKLFEKLSRPLFTRTVPLLSRYQR